MPRVPRPFQTQGHDCKFPPSRFFLSFPLSSFSYLISFPFSDLSSLISFNFPAIYKRIYTMISIQFIHSFNFTFFLFFHLFIFCKIRAFLFSIHIPLFESLIFLQIVLIVHIGFELAVGLLNCNRIRVLIIQLVNWKTIGGFEYSIGLLEENQGFNRSNLGIFDC